MPEQADPIAQAFASATAAASAPWRPPADLPLPAVDWGATVDPDDLTEVAWPPNRILERKTRLNLYHDLWRGDIGGLIDPHQLRLASVGPLNLFRRVAKFVADLLVREQPTVGDAPTDGEGFTDLHLMMLAHQLATDVVRYGTGHLLLTETAQGPMTRVVDSRYIDTMSDGAILIAEPRSRPGSASNVPDVLQFIAIQPDGTTTATAREAQSIGAGYQYQVGSILGSEEIGESTVWSIPSLPVQELPWGTSWFEDLITIVIQKARRMAANTRTLDDNSDPLLLLRGDLDRYTQLPGVPPSAGVVSDSPAAIQREADIARRLRKVGVLVLPDGIDNAEYVTWDGSLESSMAMIEQVDKDLTFISGMPAFSMEKEIPSGMSLRRMYWQFDAAVAPIFHTIYSSLSALVSRYGRTLQWENVFEVVEGTPEVNSREDVADEATARRGESNDAPN